MTLIETKTLNIKHKDSCEKVVLIKSLRIKSELTRFDKKKVQKIYIEHQKIRKSDIIF